MYLERWGFTCAPSWESIFEGYVSLLSHTSLLYLNIARRATWAYWRIGVQETVPLSDLKDTHFSANDIFRGYMGGSYSYLLTRFLASSTA